MENIQKILSISIIVCLAPMLVLLIYHKSLLYHDGIMSVGGKGWGIHSKSISNRIYISTTLIPT